MAEATRSLIHGFGMARRRAVLGLIQRFGLPFVRLTDPVLDFPALPPTGPAGLLPGGGSVAGLGTSTCLISRPKRLHRR